MAPARSGTSPKVTVSPPRRKHEVRTIAELLGAGAEHLDQVVRTLDEHLALGAEDHLGGALEHRARTTERGALLRREQLVVVVSQREALSLT